MTARGRRLAAAVMAVGLGAVGYHVLVAVTGTETPGVSFPAVHTGPELSLIYVGTSTCSWCNKPDLPELVSAAKQNLRHAADKAGIQFSYTGIALNRSTDRGLEHLEKFGPFDELLVGRRWLNLGLARYIWDDIPGPAATPQLIITIKALLVPDSMSLPRYWGFTNERLITRKVGYDEIRAFAMLGAPIPLTGFLEYSPGT